MGCHMGMVTVDAILTTIRVGVKIGIKDIVVANVPPGSWITGIIRNMGMIAGSIPGNVSDCASLLSLQVAPSAAMPEPTIRMKRTAKMKNHGSTS